MGSLYVLRYGDLGPMPEGEVITVGPFDSFEEADVAGQKIKGQAWEVVEVLPYDPDDLPT